MIIGKHLTAPKMYFWMIVLYINLWIKTLGFRYLESLRYGFIRWTS